MTISPSKKTEELLKQAEILFKGNNMSKKEDRTLPQFEKADMTHIALTVVSKLVDGKTVWFTVEVPVNPLTGQTGEVKLVEAGPSKDFAIEKFKMRAYDLAIVRS